MFDPYDWMNLLLGYLIGIPGGTVAGLLVFRSMTKAQARELASMRTGKFWKMNQEWHGYEPPRIQKEQKAA